MLIFLLLFFYTHNQKRIKIVQLEFKKKENKFKNFSMLTFFFISENARFNSFSLLLLKLPPFKILFNMYFKIFNETNKINMQLERFLSLSHSLLFFLESTHIFKREREREKKKTRNK